MNDSVSTTGGAIMVLCGVGFGIGLIISFFNFDLGVKIMIYLGAAMVITFIVTVIAHFINEYK